MSASSCFPRFKLGLVRASCGSARIKTFPINIALAGFAVWFSFEQSMTVAHSRSDIDMGIGGISAKKTNGGLYRTSSKVFHINAP